MTLRILRSTLTVPASDTGSTFINADVTQADLEAAVPVGGSILPLALVFDPEDADVTIKEVVLANTKNEEGQMSLVPAGDALSLVALNKVLAPEAGGMDARRLTVAHGARLKIKAVNATGSPINISILWKVMNQIVGPQSLPGDLFSPRVERVPRTSNFISLPGGMLGNPNVPAGLSPIGRGPLP